MQLLNFINVCYFDFRCMLYVCVCVLLFAGCHRDRFGYLNEAKYKSYCDGITFMSFFQRSSV